MSDPRVDSELFVQYAMRLTKNRLRVVELGSALLATGAALVGEMLVLVWLDHGLEGGLSSVGLALGRWAMLVTVVGMLAMWVVRPVLWRINDLYIARLIERAHPQFRNDLTAALQLGHDERVRQRVRSALTHRAAEDLVASEFESSVDSRPLARTGLALGGLVLLGCLYALVSPKGVFPSLARTFGADQAAPTRCEILSVRPESATRVLLGRPVLFGAEVRRPDGAPQVEISRDGLRYLQEDCLPMAETQRDRRVHTFARQWDSSAVGPGELWFRVRAGDAVSPPRRMVVLPVPTVLRTDLTLAWPAYTGRPAAAVNGPGIEALPGSTLTVAIETNSPVQRGSLEFAEGPAIRMTTDPASPRRLVGRFEIVRPDRFRVSFTDTFGHANGDGVDHTLHLLEDRPPTIARTWPPGEVEVAPDDALRLSGEVGDDFGLAEVRLHWLAPGGSGERVLASHEPPGRSVVPVELRMEAAELGRPGERIECWLSARDFRPPDGQSVRSEPFFVTLTPPRAEPLASARPEEPLAPEPPAVNDPDAPSAQGQGEAVADEAASAAAEARQAQHELAELARRDRHRLEALREHLAAGPRDRAADSPAGQADGADAGPAQPAPGQAAPGQAAPPADADGPPSGPAGGESSDAGPSTSHDAGGADDPASQPPGAPGQSPTGPPGPGRGASPGDEGDSPGPAAGAEGDGADQPAAAQPGQGAAPGQTPSEGSGGEGGQGDGEPSEQGEGHGEGASQGQGEAGQGGQVQTPGGDGEASSPSAIAGAGDQSAGGVPQGTPAEASAPETTQLHERSTVEPLADPAGGPEPLLPLETVGRLMNEAHRQVRNGQVDPALLEAMDMTGPQFAQFVREYTERRDRGGGSPAAAPAGTAPPRLLQSGTASAGSGQRLGGGSEGTVAGTVEGQADEMGNLAPGRQLRVARPTARWSRPTSAPSASRTSRSIPIAAALARGPAEDL